MARGRSSAAWAPASFSREASCQLLVRKRTCQGEGNNVIRRGKKQLVPRRSQQRYSHSRRRAGASRCQQGERRGQRPGYSCAALWPTARRAGSGGWDRAGQGGWACLPPRHAVRAWWAEGTGRGSPQRGEWLGVSRAPGPWLRCCPQQSREGALESHMGIKSSRSLPVGSTQGSTSAFLTSRCGSSGSAKPEDGAWPSPGCWAFRKAEGTPCGPRKGGLPGTLP